MRFCKDKKVQLAIFFNNFWAAVILLKPEFQAKQSEIKEKKT